MYIWIHDKYSSTSFKQRLWKRKIVLMWQNQSGSDHVCHCGAAVKEVLAPADKPSSPPGNAVFCFFVPFFFLFGLFLTLFFLLAFFLYSYCWPCWSCTWINIYFKLKSGVLFWKRDFKSSWSAYWPSLRPEKNHKLSRNVSPPWIFFKVS